MTFSETEKTALELKNDSWKKKKKLAVIWDKSTEKKTAPLSSNANLSWRLNRFKLLFYSVMNHIMLSSLVRYTYTERVKRPRAGGTARLP